MTLYIVDAPYFYAAYIVGKRGLVVRCAPILRRHVLGLSEVAAWSHCKTRRWRVMRGSTR